MRTPLLVIPIYAPSFSKETDRRPRLRALCAARDAASRPYLFHRENLTYGLELIPHVFFAEEWAPFLRCRVIGFKSEIITALQLLSAATQPQMR